ncbi:MAG: acetylserotonin O-methyltransferase [Desulfobacterales bacterium]|nr:acetylserotonin O-methyltransferase [Desulfobacterales bacterium]
MDHRHLDKKIIADQMQIVNDVAGAWKVQVLYALIELDIFEILNDQKLTTEEIGSRVHVPVVSLERLLNGAVSTGYLRKHQNGYENTPTANQVLVKGKPGYLGNYLKLTARWNRSFGKLGRAVRSNEPVEDANAMADEEYRTLFIKGMIDYAAYRGTDVLNHIDLEDRKRLIDIGCGPAVYTEMFASAYPQLRCTAYDLPDALAIARERIRTKEETGQNRLEWKPGNYLTDDSYGTGFDVVFLSHVLHQESPEDCRRILKKSFHALNPGGVLIIQAMFLSEDGLGSVYTALHDLLALLIFPGGYNYSKETMIPWLEALDYVNIRSTSMSMHNINSLILADKER